MLNKKESESLKKLEEMLGKKLPGLALKNIWEGATNGYSSDEEGNIVGLNLYDAKLADFSFLRDFPRLTHLNLVDNQISDLSPLRTLINLTELYLYRNQISELSPLQHLTNLTTLYLNSNQISDLSPLQQLTNLTVLNLYNNQISDLSPLLPLKKLQCLLLINNKITRLPEEWAGREMKIQWEYQYPYDGLFLRDNPLESPPVEIAQQGDAAVRNYFKEIKERDTVLLLHSKLLLVGSGAVGKTTLVKKLQKPKFKVQVGKEPTTHGIRIAPWELSCSFAQRDTHPVKIHSWDFGGQDIMYTTHQFFLTKRSLYLFVWEARLEGQETASFEYWLNIIKLLSAASPVIIVMNKADTRSQSLDEASFRQKFPFIRAFIQVSCLNGTGIKELTELIRTALSEMPHLLDRLPKTWLQIRDDLKKQNKDYISRADYLALCKKRDLTPDRAEFLSDYLHDLGAILHFRGEPLLADTVILNPEWATAAVYKIMDSPAILNNKGKFHYYDLKTYWDPRTFPVEKHPQLLSLMEKFELCYRVPETNIYILPELLPAAPPPDLERDRYRGPGSLRFEIHYEFMPRGILSRFITRLYYLIRGERFWKNGVELALENTYALVQSEPLDRKLTVSVTGADQRELLAIARDHLDYIHRTLNMERDRHYREMIPCGCGTCREAAQPHLFQHQVLKTFAAKGKPFIHCQVSADEVSIAGLLKGYAPPAQKTDLTGLLPTLIKTAAQLQGIAKTIKPGEDSRNSFIALLLTVQGYRVKDQTRRGSSPSGKGPGELDILIETPDGTAESVIEAFNLKGLHCGVIDTHFQKLFGYDAHGLETDYIIVYAESAAFGALWQEYLDHLPAAAVKYKLQGAPLEENTPFAEIKLARTLHERQNRHTTVYHLFINMNP